MMISNLFDDLPADTDKVAAEIFDALLTQSDIRIERIISTGQASPPGFWYCQPENEWVMVLQGSAALRFAGETENRVLLAGDFLHIPAQCRHRVEWTDANQTTLWLAVHYSEKSSTTMGEER
ncbi:cupin domain-containing protein [Rouxiella aceris]|uniref:cupin domain-containing protein n=1 Tax=Rouxiella aceris TaxID=2703884 RepID=UPI002852B5E2|nr:cupin domain-containing protein [Rouxiella aceris]